METTCANRSLRVTTTWAAQQLAASEELTASMSSTLVPATHRTSTRSPLGVAVARITAGVLPELL